MPRFLFWNYNHDGPDREELLARLIHREAVDVVVLAESVIDQAALIDRLESRGCSYGTPRIPHQRLGILTRYPRDCFLGWARDEDRLCLRRLRVPGCEDILLGAVHLVSGLHRERAERKSESDPLARAVRDAQRELGHSRTVLVGDFNLNPFDDGMVFPDGFGAMMTKALVRKNALSRGAGARVFYNPMWSRLGQEVSQGPPGTYYWSNRRPLNIYWNYPDQVLIGHDLLDHFPDGQFRILTSIPGSDNGWLPLVRETGLHWKLDVSDHLPLIFDLDLPEEPNHV